MHAVPGKANEATKNLPPEGAKGPLQYSQLL